MPTNSLTFLNFTWANPRAEEQSGNDQYVEVTTEIFLRFVRQNEYIWLPAQHVHNNAAAEIGWAHVMKYYNYGPEYGHTGTNLGLPLRATKRLMNMWAFHPNVRMAPDGDLFYYMENWAEREGEWKWQAKWYRFAKQTGHRIGDGVEALIQDANRTSEVAFGPLRKGIPELACRPTTVPTRSEDVARRFLAMSIRDALNDIDHPERPSPGGRPLDPPMFINGQSRQESQQFRNCFLHPGKDPLAFSDEFVDCPPGCLCQELLGPRTRSKIGGSKPMHHWCLILIVKFALQALPTALGQCGVPREAGPLPSGWVQGNQNLDRIMRMDLDVMPLLARIIIRVIEFAQYFMLPFNQSRSRWEERHMPIRWALSEPEPEAADIFIELIRREIHLEQSFLNMDSKKRERGADATVEKGKSEVFDTLREMLAAMGQPLPEDPKSQVPYRAISGCHDRVQKGSYHLSNRAGGHVSDFEISDYVTREILAGHVCPTTAEMTLNAAGNEAERDANINKATLQALKGLFEGYNGRAADYINRRISIGLGLEHEHTQNPIDFQAQQQDLTMIGLPEGQDFLATRTPGVRHWHPWTFLEPDRVNVLRREAEEARPQLSHDLMRALVRARFSVQHGQQVRRSHPDNVVQPRQRAAIGQDHTPEMIEEAVARSAFKVREALERMELIMSTHYGEPSFALISMLKLATGTYCDLVKRAFSDPMSFLHDEMPAVRAVRVAIPCVHRQTPCGQPACPHCNGAATWEDVNANAGTGA